MLIDLKAHYLDLIVSAIEAGGNACLHRPDPAPRESGAIYVTRKPKQTRAEYVMRYSFDETRFYCRVEFADGRPTFAHYSYYVDGLEAFWPAWRKALSANRLEDHSAEPERGPQGDYALRAARG